MAKKAAGIDRMASGLYRSRFTVEGKRYSVYGATVAECRQKESEKRSQIAAGIEKFGKEMTVDTYFDKWIKKKEGSVTEATLRINKVLYNGIKSIMIDSAGTVFGALKLRKVTTENVRDLQSALRKTKDSTRTTNDRINLLKSIFKTAVEERIITWNPAAPVKPLKRTEEQARNNIHRALTKKETASFLKKAEEENSAYYNLYVFLLNTGLRLGEAGALTVFDVSSKTAHIERTITRTLSGGYEIGQDTKTAAGKRSVPLSEAAFEAWQKQQEVNSALYGKIETDKPIFRSPRGALIVASSVDTDIKNICQKAGIEKFTAHAFRDTFATRCVESGMEVKSLQEILGHTDVSMTLGLYAHGNEERKIEQLKAVNFS